MAQYVCNLLRLERLVVDLLKLILEPTDDLFVGATFASEDLDICIFYSRESMIPVERSGLQGRLVVSSNPQEKRATERIRLG